MAAKYPIPADVHAAIVGALAILPLRMDSIEARCLLLSIGLQESRFTHRYQVSPQAPGGKGPARGWWQFERGSVQSKGGVWGVVLHPATAGHLLTLCEARKVPFDAGEIHSAIEKDDVLAAGLARLLLFSDPRALPKLNDVEGAWALYLRTWRPGKPHRHTWAACHDTAVAAVNRRAA